MEKFGTKVRSSIALILVLTIICMIVPVQSVIHAQEELQEIPTVQNEVHLEDYTEMYGWEKITDSKPMISSNQMYRARSATTTNINYLAILIEFPDADMQNIRLDDEYTLKAADMVMNSGGTNILLSGEVPVISLKDYLNKYSYQNLNVTTSFFPKVNGNTVSHVSKKSRTYYMRKTASNPDGYSNYTEQAAREKELLEEVIQAVKPSIEAQFSGADLDTNGDGYIDAISFFVEGKSLLIEEGDAIVWQDLLWSHKTDGNFSVQIAGKKIGSYNLNNAQNSLSPGGTFSHEQAFNPTVTVDQLKLRRASYSVIHHEFLHTLGLPDLYRSSNQGDPVGFYDIMASNNGDYPQSMLSLLSRESLQWGSRIQEITSSGTITINRPQYTDSNEVVSYKIYSPLSDTEYFIVEFYEKQDYVVNTGRADGFIIYRVNTDLATNINGGTDGRGDYIFVFRPGETSLGAAQGALTDAVVLPNVNNTYGKELAQASSSWDSDTLYYSNGQNSGIKLEVTASDTNSITLNVTIPEVQGSGTAQDPYLISSVDDWNRLVRDDKHVKIMKDIDFSGTTQTPITGFTGVVDGNGKTLSNITVNDSAGNVGLFSSITGGSISNLTISNLQVTGTNTKGNVGGLAGQISGGVINNVVITSGTVTGGTGSRVGGFVGYMGDGATITDCYTSANVSDGDSVGGFIGITTGGTVQNSFANGQVGVSATGNSGGFYGSGSVFGGSALIFTGCAYDMRTTGYNVAAGSGDVTGITGYQIPETISLDLGGTNEAKLNMTTKPVISSVSAVCRFGSTGIANFNNDTQTIYGVTVGNTAMYIDIAVGTHNMSLTTQIQVTDSSVADKPITAITVSPTTLDLTKGEKQTLNAEITPADTTEDKTIIWTSSDEKVATVNQNGEVTAVGGGSTTITATTANGIHQAVCTVNVKVPIAGVTVLPTTLDLTKGEKQTLNAEITPADTTEDKTITWTSSDEKVATVNQNGEVTAVGGGSTTITATTATGIQATCVVTVTVPMEGIIITPDVLTLEKGKDYTLQTTITPADTTDNTAITWSSSDDTIVAVDATSGVVTAKAAGTATITATAGNGLKSTCTVTVIVPSTSISVSNNQINLLEGEMQTVTAGLLPADTTDSAVFTWSSADSTIATVDQRGNITGVKEGKTQITVSASLARNTPYTATIDVTVSANAFLRLQNKYNDIQNAVNSGLYQNAPEAFIQALNSAMLEAETQLNLGQGNAIDADLNKAYDALHKALQNFTYTDALNEMQVLVSIDLSLYDASTTAGFEAKTAEAQQILQDPIAALDRISTVLQELKTAAQTMVLLDSTALQQEITVSNGIDLTQYLDGVEKDFFIAQLANVQNVLASATTNAEYQAAANALATARQQMEAVRKATDEQKAQIQSGITELQDMLKHNTYSNENRAQIETAVQTAQQMLANPNLTFNETLSVLNTIEQAKQLQQENQQGSQTIPDQPQTGTDNNGQSGTPSGGQMSNADGVNQQNNMSGNVQTGDATALWSITATMILSVCGVVLIVIIRVRGKQKAN